MYADWIYKIAEKAIELHGEREIILWGDYIVSQQIEEILDSRYHLKIFGYVDNDLQKIDNERVYGIDHIKGGQNKYFIVIPLAFHQSIKDKLKDCGYSSGGGYYYYNDCIVEDREDYYEDARGNRIIGKRANIKIIFNGDNSVVRLHGVGIKNDSSIKYIHIGNNSTIDIKEGYVSKADFEIDDDVNLYIGEKCMISGNVELMKGACMSVEAGCYIEAALCLRKNATFKIGNECVIHADIMDIRDRTVCLIGSHVTTGRNFTVSVGDDTTLQIGNDCMFSYDIAIYTNDAHTIFDVRSGENINSTKEKCLSRKVIIGEHVWIGFRAMILYNTVVENGSVIGAYSLVKGRIPNNCIAAGIPAKVVRCDISWSRNDCEEDIAGCGLEYVNMTVNG